MLNESPKKLFNSQLDVSKMEDKGSFFGLS